MEITLNSSNFNESHTIIEEERHIEQDSDLTITEKQAIIKARIGQGVYREKLLKKYGKCIITDIDIKQVLVASHIKPWAVCNNYDRVNTNNGLILSATYDKLFDGGLISFTPTGKLLISRHINDKNRTILHLNINKVFDLKYTAEMKDFLLYHNDVVFVR